MTVHVTHLTNEELPEPGTLRRVVSVHPGNRTYETVPVGHHPGFLVADPHGTNSVYWVDDEVDEVHDGWVVKGGVPAMVLSRHGQQPEPGPEPESAPQPKRGRRPRVETTQVTQGTEATGQAITIDLGSALKDEEGEE